MKIGIYISLVVAVILGMASCKEQPIVLNHSVAGTDSTYVTTPESPQPKKILATELTGVQCPNCPDGALLLEQINDQHNDELVIVSLHAGVLTKPFHESGVPESHYDLRTTQGLALLNQVLGGDPGTKPNVSYNRLPLSHQSINPLFLDTYSSKWLPGFDSANARENPVLINVTVNSQLNTNSGKYDITAKVAYNKAVSGNQRLNIFLVEDSIVDVQETSNPLNQYDSNYVFMNVFRDAVTGISGQPILDSLSTKEAGRVFIYHTSVALTPPEGQTWVAKHIHVVAFVSAKNGTDIHVYQAAETKLQ